MIETVLIDAHGIMKHNGFCSQSYQYLLELLSSVFVKWIIFKRPFWLYANLLIEAKYKQEKR